MSFYRTIIEKHGDTLRSASVSTKQQWIASTAQQKPKMVFNSINHFIDSSWLRCAYEKVRKDGALGVDKVSAAEYSEDLEKNLTCLLGRIRSGTYKAPPVRKVQIPKADGKTRGLGIPTFEDKVAQKAISMLLEPIFEQDFLNCSFGFRPGKSTHQALRSLRNGIMDKNGRFILDVDIEKYFDSIDHRWLLRAVKTGVSDGVVCKMICKWLKAGVFEDKKTKKTRVGTPQGGVISPLLSNIFLHFVLDLWFEKVVRPRLKGQATLARYCDDFVIVLSDYLDCSKIRKVLSLRLQKLGLTINAKKTNIVDFRHSGKSRTTFATKFSFLGFTHIWKKSRKGKWIVHQRTAKDRLSSSLSSIHHYCKFNRHSPIATQYKGLCSRVNGHYAYFGISGNDKQLKRFHHRVESIWRFWLSRRSRKSQIGWEKFRLFLNRFPLPTPRIVHQYKPPGLANL